MIHSQKVQAISLFSGAGGLDIGCKKSGVEVKIAIDNDPDSVETLKLNQTSLKTKILNENLKEYNPNKMEEYLNQKKLIIIGGPPCQPFSKNGYWITNNNRKITKDPRNCLDDFFKSVNQLNPEGFLIENVDSILHPVNKKAVDRIIHLTKKNGYKLKMIRANALDYGVPQKRRRVFFMGSKKEFISEPLATHYNPITDQENKKSLRPYESVGIHIKEFATKKYEEDSENTSNGTYYNELKKVMPGLNYLSLCDGKKSNFKKNTRFWNFLLKLKPNLPSWTIAAQPGPWVGPFHWSNRRLRVPEIAAIQTFPKNYKFYGNRRSIQKQIGNAVPPLLGKAMIDYLVKNLK